MTELEKLIEQRKELDMKIAELKKATKYYGKDKILKVEHFTTLLGEDAFYVSVKQNTHSREPGWTWRSFKLVERTVDKQDEVFDYIIDVRDALNEYLKSEWNM